MAKALLYATAYQFLPEGLKRLRELVNDKLEIESLVASHDYNRHRRSFRICCDADDESKVLAVFHGVIKKLIDDELLDEYDEQTPSKLIAHVIYDADENEIVPGPEGYDDVEYELSYYSDDSAEDDGEQESDAESLLDLDLFEFRSDWQCQTDDLALEIIVPKTAQSVIGFLTGTKLVEYPSDQIIQIFGESQEDCDLAIHKLDVLHKYCDVPRYYLNHIFYSEIKDDFRVSLMPLPELKRMLVETTLIDPSLSLIWPYENLHELYTARCCEFSRIQSCYILAATRKLVPMVQLEDIDKQFQCWKNYIYPSKGNILLDYTQQASHPALISLSEEDTTIENWLERDMPETMSQTLSQMTQDLVMPTKPDSSPAVESEYLHPRNNNKATPNLRSKTNILSEKVSVSRPPSSLEESRGGFSEAGSQPLVVIESKTSDLSPICEDEDLLGFHPGYKETSSAASTGGHGFGDILKFDNLQVSDHPQSLLDGEDDDEARVSWVLFEGHGVDPPRSLLDGEDVDSPQSLFGAGHGGHSRSLLDGDVVGSPRSLPDGDEIRASQSRLGGSAVDYSDPEYGLFAPENKGGDSWLTYKDTGEATSQKDKEKARPSFFPATIETSGALQDPSLYFRKEMKDTMEAILASLRDWQGDIVLEAQIGRLLVRPFSHPIVASIDRPSSYTARYMRDLLLESPMKVGFTKLSTMLPADIESLVGMQDELGLPLWGEVFQRSVTYEYVCCHHEVFDEPCKPFVIEMDADTFDTKVHTAPIQAGGVYVHCLMRDWDYFVSASGTRNLDEQYGSLAQEIADSTYIAPNMIKPELIFALDSAQYHFMSIRVRRLSQYLTCDEKTILNVTEVQNLEVECIAYEEELVVTAKCPDKSKELQTWYEVTIKSAAAQDAFAENVDLAFGEESSWSEETLLGEGASTLADICYPANYMIKKLDGLGLYTNNGACTVGSPVPEEEFW